ncbi:MAG: hypothetical protein Q7R67_02200 [bacterium]|nr:hypothetical protein [bacterium]
MQTENTGLAGLIRRFSQWYKEVGAALDGAAEIKPTVRLMLENNGVQNIVLVERETVEGWVCLPERSFFWYALWPLVPDPMTTEKRFISKKDERIRGIILG